MPEAPADAGAADQAGLAEKVIADLYKDHNGKKSPFFQKKDRGSVDKYFTKQLADLIWKDATKTPDGEVGALDGDPLYNAQDTDIKNFVIGKATIKGDAASVPVNFTNFGNKVTITFDLKNVTGAWKIDNINYGNGENLAKWLKESAADTGSSSSSEFEGKYQVGDTSCTVKPVKMAFEVRWAKGSGAETFFFKEGNTFESDSGNRFVFDNPNYSTGTFYRSDSKTFSVKRG